MMMSFCPAHRLATLVTFHGIIVLGLVGLLYSWVIKYRSIDWLIYTYLPRLASK